MESSKTELYPAVQTGFEDDLLAQIDRELTFDYFTKHHFQFFESKEHHDLSKRDDQPDLTQKQNLMKSTINQNLNEELIINATILNRINKSSENQSSNADLISSSRNPLDLEEDDEVSLLNSCREETNI